MHCVKSQRLCTRAVSGKDFEDTPNNRRIFFGWATVDTSPQTLARVVTYHPQLKQLVFSPAPEYEKLHGQAIGHVGELKQKLLSALALPDFAVVGILM